MAEDNGAGHGSIQGSTLARVMADGLCFSLLSLRPCFCCCCCCCPDCCCYPCCCRCRCCCCRRRRMWEAEEARTASTSGRGEAGSSEQQQPSPEELLERLSRVMGGGWGSPMRGSPFGDGGRLDPFGSSSSEAWHRYESSGSSSSVVCLPTKPGFTRS